MRGVRWRACGFDPRGTCSCQAARPTAQQPSSPAQPSCLHQRAGRPVQWAPAPPAAPAGPAAAPAGPDPAGPAPAAAPPAGPGPPRPRQQPLAGAAQLGADCGDGCFARLKFQAAGADGRASGGANVRGQRVCEAPQYAQTRTKRPNDLCKQQAVQSPAATAPLARRHTMVVMGKKPGGGAVVPDAQKAQKAAGTRGPAFWLRRHTLLQLHWWRCCQCTLLQHHHCSWPNARAPPGACVRPRSRPHAQRSQQPAPSPPVHTHSCLRRAGEADKAARAPPQQGQERKQGAAGQRGPAGQAGPAGAAE